MNLFSTQLTLRHLYVQAPEYFVLVLHWNIKLLQVSGIRSKLSSGLTSVIVMCEELQKNSEQIKKILENKTVVTDRKSEDVYRIETISATMFQQPNCLKKIFIHC